jgi:hypothetical protein
MLGGFVLAALSMGMVVAWPGRRRWPWWLIVGLTASVTSTLALTLGRPTGWPQLVWVPSALVSLGFITAAGVRDLRDPSRR